jgi:hypothetical protein
MLHIILLLLLCPALAIGQQRNVMMITAYDECHHNAELVRSSSFLNIMLRELSWSTLFTQGKCGIWDKTGIEIQHVGLPVFEE